MKIRLFLLLVPAVLLIPSTGFLSAAENAGGGEPATYKQLKELAAERKWSDIVANLNEKDLTAAAGAMGQPADVLYALRGRANWALKRGPEAEADYRAAIELVPTSAEYWAALGTNYRDTLKNPSAALEAFKKAIDISLQGGGNRMGYMPVSVEIDAAGLLCDEGKYDEALSMLSPYDEAMLARMAPVWKVNALRALGKIYLAQGREQEALDCFQKALETEAVPK